MKPGLDRETITCALRRLSELLRERTKDVDAVFQPPRTQYLLEEIFEESGGQP